MPKTGAQKSEECLVLSAARLSFPGQGERTRSFASPDFSGFAFFPKVTVQVISLIQAGLSVKIIPSFVYLRIFNGWMLLGRKGVLAEHSGVSAR